MPRFVFDAALRWSDMDAYGHLNNTRYLYMYEEARVALLFTSARDAGISSFEQGVVIFRHEVDYLKPVDYGPYVPGSNRAPHVRIELWLDELRAATFRIAYEMIANGVVASRAKTVCVPFDFANSRPRKLTDAEDGYLRPLLETAR